MRSVLAFLPLAPLLLSLAACSTPRLELEALQPRSAEAIDPRLPVEPLRTATPVDAALLEKVDALKAQAAASVPPFEQALIRAARLAETAGGEGSESWVEAQQALSAAQALRGPLMLALGDLDALLDADIAPDQRIASSDRQYLMDASAELTTIANGQQDKIVAIEALLRR